MREGYFVDPSTASYNDVMDAGWAEPSGDSDTGSIYDDVSAYHGQTLDQFRRWGVNLSPERASQLQKAFANVQSNAKSSSAWAAVQGAHETALRVLADQQGHQASPEQARVLLGHFQRLSQAMPGGGGILRSIGGALSTVGSTVQGAVKAVTNNPLWDVAKTGVSFIPGVGTAVSAGMAGASALGRGESLANIGLAAARGALPGGAITQAAFDAAIGLAKGQNVTDTIVQAVRSEVPGGAIGQAAFDAATAIAKGHALDDAALGAIRANVPGGDLGKQAFNMAIENFRKTAPAAAKPQTFPQLSLAQNHIARALHATPALRKVSARQIATDFKTDVMNVQRAIAAIMNRLQGSQLFSTGDVGAIDSLDACCEREGVPTLSAGDTDTGAWLDVFGPELPRIRVPASPAYMYALLRRSHAPVRQAILGHGLIPRLYHQTGELTGSGGWTIRSGDTGFGIAQKLTGNGNRWKEILSANPGMSIYTAPNGSTQIRPWSIGQTITIPPSWLGSAAPVASAPLPGPSTTTTVTPVSPVLTPVSTFPASSAAATLPMLRKGDGKANGKAAGVMMWQSLLLKLGSTMVGSADGEFGPMTDAATRGYQTRMGLASDGIVGPLTWGAALRELEGKVAAAPPPVAIPAPSGPGPAIPSSANIAQLAAVQASLALFLLHHSSEVPSGAFSSSSTPPFGSVPDDVTGTWTARSRDAMIGFQSWNNAQGGRAQLPTDGTPDQASVNALMAQNTADLNKVGEAVPPPATIPVNLPPITLPGSAKPPPTTTKTTPKPAAPGAAKPVQASTGGSSSAVPIAVAIAILAALASQKGSRSRAA